MVILKVGEEVGTNVGATGEALQDRGLKVEDQVQETIEGESGSEKVA